jgi:hypothetical protein
MSYQQTVNEVRVVAQTINAEGTFDHGRIVDASAAFKVAMPVIWLYPFDMMGASGGEFIDDNMLLIGFWKQDSPKSLTSERESIIESMYQLSKQFTDLLQQNKLIRINGKIRREPQYQMYNGTVSGIAVQFTYQNFGPCIP